MQLIISARDQVLARYGNQLAAIGEGQARTVMSRALNHEGDKGRTQVKRTLVKQTGIKYGAVGKAIGTVRATPATLTYALKARGDETNIAWFGGVSVARACRQRPGTSGASSSVRSLCRGSGVPSSVRRKAGCRSGRSTGRTSRASW
jgi:hypothetical protein